MDEAPSRHSPTVFRLFWAVILGGCASFAWGQAALIVTGVLCVAIVLHRLDRPRRFRSLVYRAARRHGGTLALRRRQECYVDAYGNLIQDGWLKEREYFAERTVAPLAERRGYGPELDAHWDRVIAIIERVARSVRLPDEVAMPEDGIAYERFCAEKLGRAGWRAHVTPPSGDQGADVVAERDGVRLVVQCKRLSKPVGNAAVQEVAAAARHWSGDMAAVVSNAGFTPSARKLATSTGVLLLHHDALAALPPERPSSRTARKPRLFDAAQASARY